MQTVGVTGPVSWSVEVGLRPGAGEDFRALTAQMVEATRAEPGALIYERFVTDDGTTAHLYERYADSEAAVAHLARFAELFADRFIELVERHQAFVYGDASPDLRLALDTLHPLYLRSLDGFAR